MIDTVAKQIKTSREDLNNKPRKEWVMKGKGQSIATISMNQWTYECEYAI
jgi:N-acetylglutamate synthase-like GNAT family acetyltransferase